MAERNHKKTAPQFQALRRGEIYPGVSFPRPEGSVFEADKDGLKLLIMLAGPTPREVSGARFNPLHLALVPYGKHTTFVLPHLEPTLNGWGDAPYSLGVVQPENRGLPERESHQAFTLMAVNRHARLALAQVWCTAEAFG